MPAVITHHIFGEDVARLLPSGIVDGDEELLAFLLGNQGPDPFFVCFSTLPYRANRCHRLAREFQAGHVTRAFMSLRDSVSHLPAEDERVGRAFALGVMGHYVLDRAVHPFVYSQQFALMDFDERLAKASSEIHAIIESDLDTWLLWEKRQATVEERPVTDDLMRTDRIDNVAGALFAQTALAVYGITLGVEDYAGAVRDYAWEYRRIDPAGSRRTRLVGTLERLVRPHSMAESLAHLVARTDECPSANLGRNEWVHPFTGETSHSSFADLYDEASLAYPEIAEAFARGDEARLARLVGGLNYEGRIVEDDVTPR